MENEFVISSSVFWAAILSSTLISTIVAFALGWVKEYFQKRSEIEQHRFENLYGELSFHLLSMKVLRINRMELINEIIKEPIGSTIEESMNKFREINPLIKRWHEHKDKIKVLLETNSGYINKKHLTLIEDFLDGCIKREITEEGKNRRTTELRTNKMLDAIEALQSKLLET